MSPTSKNGTSADPTRLTYDEAASNLSAINEQVGEPHGGDPLQRSGTAAAPVHIKPLIPGALK
jgi:hypothetical protein